MFYPSSDIPVGNVSKWTVVPVWTGRSSVEHGSSAWCVDVIQISSFPWGHKARTGFTILELELTTPGCWDMGVLEGMLNFGVPHARGVTGQP